MNKPPASRRPSSEMITLTAVFLSASFLFGILAFLVRNGITDAWDTSVLLWINSHASPAFDTFFVALTQLGGVRVVVAVTLVLTLYLIIKKQYLRAAFVVVSIGGAALLGAVFKAVFERTRPDLWEWLIHETSFSFPSGHATASMALALTIIVLMWRTKWRVITLIAGGVYVLAIGLSRLYLGVHFPTDILGGWLLSLGWVSLVALGCLLITTSSYSK